MQVLGLREMKGKSKESGKPYDAVLLFVTDSDPAVIGLLTADIWVPRDVWNRDVNEPIDDGFLGREVFPSYNKRGYLIAIKFM